MDDDYGEAEGPNGRAYDPTKRTRNDDLLGIQLFADVDWTDRSAVQKRKRELAALNKALG